MLSIAPEKGKLKCCYNNYYDTKANIKTVIWEYISNINVGDFFVKFLIDELEVGDRDIFLATEGYGSIPTRFISIKSGKRFEFMSDDIITRYYPTDLDKLMIVPFLT